MEDRYDIGVDIGEGKDWWYVHGRTTHDKVYELNRQMCDLDIPLRNPIEPLSEETAQELIGKYEKIGKEWASKKKEIFESIFGNITNEKSNIMEKKTKKMTKAEAFEWLKHKKVYVGGNSAVIQEKLFEAGFEWAENKRNISNLEQPFLILSEGGGIFYSNNMCHYLERSHEEISADDILSIEIVEDGFNYDKVVELAKPLMHYLNEVGCPDGIRVSQLGIVHEPMSTLIFDNGIGRIE